MAAKRQIEAWLFLSGYETYLTNKQPVWEEGTLVDAPNADSTRLCGDTIRSMIGIPRKLQRNEIVKVTLTVDNIQLMEYEIKTTFKQFTYMTKKEKGDKKVPKKERKV